MLPPNYLEEVEKQAVNVYNDLELEIIKQISERIANVGYANTVSTGNGNAIFGYNRPSI